MPLGLSLIHLFVFLDILGVGLILPVLPAVSKELGIEPWLVGLMSTFYGAGQVIGSPFMGALSDRKGRKVVLLTSFTVCAIAYGLIGSATSVQARTKTLTHEDTKTHKDTKTHTHTYN